MNKYNNIHWIPEDNYKKAEFHLRAALVDIFEPFNELGHQIFISGAIDEVIQAAVDFSLVTRGVNKPIRVSKKRNSR